MCGITGIVSFAQEFALSSDELRRMTELLSHRGPDGHGFFEEGRIGLGHRRLAIVDLSAGGAQPKTYRDRFVISYNGEIYNYVELREELRALGHSFDSDSDSEVLLAAFAEWNVGALDHLNGMFAFALLDRLTGDLHLVRDRFGVKPLYYFETENAFYFASEPKAFTCLSQWRARLNQTIALDFLRYGISDFSRETFFEGVFQLPPGHRAVLHDSSRRLEVHEWYNPDKKSKFKGSFEEACDTFRNIFRDSVRLRLRSDVKVGSCLSGGLDSSSIVCQMHELLKGTSSIKNQETVSACSTVPAFDERPFMDEVNRLTNTQSHRVFPSFESLVEALDRAVWHQDEPFVSTSMMAQWFVFEEARRKNIPVMLDGQGADEQLAGYAKSEGTFLIELFWRLSWFRLGSEAISLIRKAGVLYLVRSVARNIMPLWVHALLRGVISHRNPRIFRWMRAFSLRQSALREITRTSLPLLLRYEDRNSMAHSIESRTPFLDYRLVEHNLSLPARFKIRRGVSKYILRESMKGILPTKVAERKDKMAFVTPEATWIREHSKMFLEAAKEAQEISGNLGGSRLYARVRKAIVGPGPFDPLVWRVVILGRWMRVFNVSRQ